MRHRAGAASQRVCTLDILSVGHGNPKPGAPRNHHARLFTTSDGKGYDYKIGLNACIPGTQTGGPRRMAVVNKGL